MGSDLRTGVMPRSARLLLPSPAPAGTAWPFFELTGKRRKEQHRAEE